MNTPYHENLEKIRSYRVTPPTSAWRVVREKMARDRLRRKAAMYRNITIAACFLALLSTSGILFHWIHEKVDRPLVSSAMIIEELPFIENDPFYNHEKMIMIKDGKYNFR
ncbi:MAG TPA: hypothetical protein PKC30_13070 [Saprospiraceae bacterium]|nr:hypothetical protein [Saprospiraceae bacterium]